MLVLVIRLCVVFVVDLHGQRAGGVVEDGGRLGDEAAGLVPLAGLNAVADGGEVGLFVAGPELRAKDDVLELGAVGDLCFVMSILCLQVKGDGVGDKTYAASLLEI